MYAIRLQVNEVAASQIVHDRNVMFLSEPDQLADRHILRESYHFIVRLVNLEDKPGPFANRGLVIMEMGLVRCSHLAEHCPACSHDVWHPERPADLHQFSPRY